MTDYEIQKLRKAILNSIGTYVANRPIAFARDKEGELISTHIYYLTEDMQPDAQGHVIINGRTYKVMSAHDSMIFYLHDLYDNVVENMREAEDKMREVKDTMKETVKSLNRLNNLIEKTNKNLGIIHESDQALKEMRN